MATWIYKDEEEMLCNHQFFEEHLSNGWSVDKHHKPTAEEADTNHTGKLSDKEVRAAAEKAGIEGHDKKRIKTLKAALGYEDTIE